MADDNSNRQLIRLLERGGAEFRRAANQAEYNSFPNSARFTDASSIMWVLDITDAINVDHFGATGVASFDATQVFADAESMLTPNSSFHIPKGTHAVDRFLIDNKQDVLITGSGVLLGRSTENQDAVVEIKNSTGIRSRSSVTVTPNARLNYSSGVKIWADDAQGTSLLDLDFIVTNARLAWQFGDFAQLDRLVSEIVIRGGYTFNTPKVALAIGSQTVVEFTGYQMICNGTGTLASQFHELATCVGSVLHINGGECQIPAVTTGYCFHMLPVNSPAFDNTYGTIVVNGAAVESASLWCLMDNGSNVPNIKAKSGKFVLNNCTGFHSFAGTSIQGANDFSGQIVVTNTCKFFNLSDRPFATVGAPNAEVFLEDGFSDGTFREGLHGITGGIPRYPSQQIFTAFSLGGQTFTQSQATDMIFASVPTTPNNTHYLTAYNATTGIFTVPSGGLKDVRIHIEFNSIAGRPNSEITCIVDGVTPIGQSMSASRLVNSDFYLGDLVGGSTVSIRYTNLDVTWSAGANTVTDKIVMYARN